MQKCSNDNTIEVENLSKRFLIGWARTSLISNLLDRIRGEIPYRSFWTLKHINLSIKRGEIFGIIGPNGSGKTTLLKIITGILQPTEGSVRINGEVISFLQWGIGFHPDLTAKENIYLYGAFLGLTRKEIHRRFDAIVSFAEVQDFINTKLRSYSWGMRERLAFSTAIQSKADIFVLDELFAVGDMAFQKKCFGVFEGFKQNDKTIVFVSHRLDYIERFCQRALYLEKGQQVAVGEAKSVIERYKSLQAGSKAFS